MRGMDRVEPSAATHLLVGLAGDLHPRRRRLGDEAVRRTDGERLPPRGRHHERAVAPFLPAQGGPVALQFLVEPHVVDRDRGMTRERVGDFLLRLAEYTFVGVAEE